MTAPRVPLVFTVSANVPIGVGVVGLALAGFALSSDGWSLGGRLTAGIGGCALALGMALVAIRTRARVTIGASIRYHRRGRSLTLDRRAARAVIVERRPAGLTRPTDYRLQVSVDGRDVHLLVGRHLLYGGSAMAHARQIADVLTVPLHDPVGERLRASRFAPARWVGRGEEWRIALLAGLVAAPVVICLLLIE